MGIGRWDAARGEYVDLEQKEEPVALTGRPELANKSDELPAIIAGKLTVGRWDSLLNKYVDDEGR